MASPVPVTATESNATADDASPFTVSRAAGVNGQLTIAVLGTDGQPTLTWPSGYTQFFTQSQAGAFTIYGAYHQEDGTEGTTFDIISDASERWAAIVYSLSGAANPATQVPEATTVDGSVATANPDPPSITPTGGSKDYLFIAAVNNDGEEADDDTWNNFPPLFYTPFPARQKTTAAAGATTLNCSLETAEQAATTAGPEDPGVFTNDLSKTYVGATIAIHPSAGVLVQRSTSDPAISVSESLIKLGNLLRTEPAITLSETLTKLGILTQSETITISETLQKLGVRLFGETIILTEVHVGGKLLTASFTEAAIDIFDVSSLSFLRARESSESVSQSEAIQKLTIIASVETVNITELVAKLASLQHGEGALVISETISVLVTPFVPGAAGDLPTKFVVIILNQGMGG